MKSRKGPVALIVIGVLLALGPLWGLLGTMIEMMRSFNTVAGSDAGASNPDISTTLWITWAGLIMSPVGLALLIGGIVWIFRIKKAEKGIKPTSSGYRPPDSD